MTFENNLGNWKEGSGKEAYCVSDCDGPGRVHAQTRVPRDTAVWGGGIQSILSLSALTCCRGEQMRRHLSSGVGSTNIMAAGIEVHSGPGHAVYHLILTVVTEVCCSASTPQVRKLSRKAFIQHTQLGVDLCLCSFTTYPYFSLGFLHRKKGIRGFFLALQNCKTVKLERNYTLVIQVLLFYM